MASESIQSSSFYQLYMRGHEARIWAIEMDANTSGGRGGAVGVGVAQTFREVCIRAGICPDFQRQRCRYGKWGDNALGKCTLAHVCAYCVSGDRASHGIKVCFDFKGGMRGGRGNNNNNNTPDGRAGGPKGRGRGQPKVPKKE